MSLPPSPSAAEAETEVLVLQALQRGERDRARALSEAMLAEHPESPIALRLLGLTNMLERRYGAAIDAFTRSVALAPELGALINLSTCLTKVNDLERAIANGRTAVAMAPDAVPARLVLAAALHGKRRFREALAEVDAASQLSPGDPAIATRRGIILEQLGDYDGAEQSFSAASTTKETPQVRAVRFNRSFYDSIDGTIEDGMEEPAHLMSLGSAAGARYVVYVGCTADYFLKYGIVFVNSYAANSASGSLLHLHIVNPGERFTNALSDISRRLPELNLVVTTERSPLDAAKDPANTRTYYACARFLRLPGFLAHYQKPMISFDVDAVVEGPLDRILDCVGDRDLGLVLREPIDAPWWDVIAYIVGVRPTPATLAYLRRVRNYILHFFHRRQMPWALDQISLYCVLRMMERFDAAPTVVWLPREVQALTWQIGQAYDYKLGDARFKRYT